MTIKQFRTRCIDGGYTCARDFDAWIKMHSEKTSFTEDDIIPVHRYHEHMIELNAHRPITNFNYDVEYSISDNNE